MGGDSESAQMLVKEMNQIFEEECKVGVTPFIVKIDIEGAEVEVLDDLLAFLQSNPQVVIAIAAYHPYQSGATHTWIEQRCRPLPFVMAKTIFPIHRTTMLVHAANAASCQRLASLPASDKRNG